MNCTTKSAQCDFRTAPICPCPLDYLLSLAVEAVEEVERRHAGRKCEPGPKKVAKEDVRKAV